MLERCKNNVLKQFQQIKALPKNIQAKSSILILDTITAPILSDLISLQQLLQIGIKDLGRVDKIKKPDPSAIAIYYISCSSLKYLYKDFQKKVKDKSKQNEKQEHSENQPSQRVAIQPQQDVPAIYYSINLLLCESATQKVLKQISEQQQIIDRIASFGQLYIPCRFMRENVGLIPFSKSSTDNFNIRRLTKSGMPKQQQQKSQSSNMTAAMKRRSTAHKKSKQNLTSFSDIYFYEYEKQSKQSKYKIRMQQINKNLKQYGKKISESIAASINVGDSTNIKIVCYESKFSNKVKTSFQQNFIQFMEQKYKYETQNKFEESTNSQKSNSLFMQISKQPQAKQVIIIFADRSADNLSPLVRSYLYEPMIMDIFDIRDTPSRKITITNKKLSPTVIQASDRIYQKYKNTNIFEVFAKIDDNFKQFVATNKAAKFHKQTSPQKSNKSNSNGTLQSKQLQLQMSPTKSSKQIREVIQSLPQYKKISSSFQTNINILHAIASLKSERKLDDETDLQHMIVTGYNRQNKQEKDKKILQKLNIILGDPIISPTDRCRLLILAACCLDISNDDRNKLIKRLSEMQQHGDIAMGLSKLTNKGIKKYQLSSHSMKNNKQAYLDKHQCILSCVLQQLISSNNSTIKIYKQFKLQQLKTISAILKKPSVKGTLSKSKIRNIQYIVCMSGGMGYNQLADIQRMVKSYNKQDVNVSFITDYVFTPALYLQELCTMI